MLAILRILIFTLLLLLIGTYFYKNSKMESYKKDHDFELIQINSETK